MIMKINSVIPVIMKINTSVRSAIGHFGSDSQHSSKNVKIEFYSVEKHRQFQIQNLHLK